MYTHHVQDALKYNMTEEQRDDLLQIIENTNRFDIRNKLSMSCRIFPKDIKEDHYKYRDSPVAIAFFAHTFVPYQDNSRKAFRYYISLLWGDKEFTREYHDDLRKIVEDFEIMSSVSEGKVN